MKIGFIATEFITEQNFAGGFANYLYRVGKLLSDRGHEIHIFTYSLEKGTIKKDGLHIHRISSTLFRTILNNLTLRKFNISTLWMDFSWQAYKYIKVFNNEKPFDILQYPNLQFCGLIPAFFLKIPYTVRISSYAPLWNKLLGRENMPDYKLIEFLEKVFIKRAPFVFAPSKRIAVILKEEIGVHNIKIIPTPFFIDVNDWDYSIYNENLKGKPYILYFSGLLAGHKGSQILANALPEVFKRQKNISAVFIGKNFYYQNGMMIDFIKASCKKFLNRIVFLPQMNHSHLYPIISKAKLVVLPSLIDNLPNACLESMGLGAVVIATRNTSFEEIITDGENGFLTEPGNSKHLAEKIIETLSIDSKSMDHIKNNARKAIYKYSPEICINKLEEAYKKVIEDYKHGR